MKNFDQAKALDKINERLPPVRRTQGGAGDAIAVNHAVAAANPAGSAAANSIASVARSTSSLSGGGGGVSSSSPNVPAPSVAVNVTAPPGTSQSGNGPLSTSRFDGAKK